VLGAGVIIKYQFGNCFLALELWKRLGLDDFWQAELDREPVEVPWSRVAAVLAGISTRKVILPCLSSQAVSRAPEARDESR
jgi:hypothetical protein